MIASLFWYFSGHLSHFCSALTANFINLGMAIIVYGPRFGYQIIRYVCK